MPTPLVIPNANVGDAVLVDRNALGSLVSAAYNSIPGDNIVASSVPTSALQKPKAKFPYRLIQYVGNVQTAFTGVTGMKQILPYVDGASSSTWRFLHVSAVCRTLTGATGTLDILKNGSSMFGGSPPFNFATMTSGNPVVAAPLAPVSFNSWNGTNDHFQFQFSVLSGTITDLDVTVWFSLNHAGT
jgi:hypothetical protein